MGNNCCECLNCKAKNGSVTCRENRWFDENGWIKFYKEYNQIGSHFYNRMYNKSNKLIKIANDCKYFMDMKESPLI